MDELIADMNALGRVESVDGPWVKFVSWGPWWPDLVGARMAFGSHEHNVSATITEVDVPGQRARVDFAIVKPGDRVYFAR